MQISAKEEKGSKDTALMKGEREIEDSLWMQKSRAKDFEPVESRVDLFDHIRCERVSENAP